MQQTQRYHAHSWHSRIIQGLKILKVQCLPCDDKFGSHIVWMFTSITFILLFGVCCRMVFDPGGGRHKKNNNKGCCHEETCRSEDRSFARRRG